jgi:hypothetical protein
MLILFFSRYSRLLTRKANIKNKEIKNSIAIIDLGIVRLIFNCSKSFPHLLIIVSLGTMLAPIACVIAPASVARIFVSLIESNTDDFP